MYTIKLESLSTTASPQKKLRNINAAWWTAISIAQAFALTGFQLSNAQIITDSLVSNLLLAGCCMLIFNNMRYYLPRQEKVLVCTRDQYYCEQCLALSI
jgi:hypothetical protein